MPPESKNDKEYTFNLNKDLSIPQSSNLTGSNMTYPSSHFCNKNKTILFPLSLAIYIVITELLKHIAFSCCLVTLNSRICRYNKTIYKKENRHTRTRERKKFNIFFV